MFPKPKTILISSFSLTILIVTLGLVSCNETNRNENLNRNSNYASNTNKNSNSQNNEETKEYEDAVVGYVFSIPPTSDGGGGTDSHKTEYIKEKLGISSLKELAILLTPLKYSVTVEALNLEIYSGDKKVFEIATRSSRTSQTFPPLERRSSNFIGYQFELDPNKAAEGDRFFVTGNTIKLSPTIKRENGASATFYLVNRNAEVNRTKQAQ